MLFRSLIGDWGGEQTHFDSGDVVAGNPKVFAQLLSVITEG